MNMIKTTHEVIYELMLIHCLKCKSFGYSYKDKPQQRVHANAKAAPNNKHP